MTLIQTKQKPAREQRNKYKPRTETSTNQEQKQEQHLPIRHAGRPADLSISITIIIESSTLSTSSASFAHIGTITVTVNIYNHYQHHRRPMVMLIFCNLFCCGCSRFSLGQDALRDHYSSQFWLGWHGGGVANSIELTGILQNRNAVKHISEHMIHSTRPQTLDWLSPLCLGTPQCWNLKVVACK